MDSEAVPPTPATETHHLDAPTTTNSTAHSRSKIKRRRRSSTGINLAGCRVLDDADFAALEAESRSVSRRMKLKLRRLEEHEDATRTVEEESVTAVSCFNSFLFSTTTEYRQTY